MQGIEDMNVPAFRAAAEQLRRRGYAVIDPSQTQGDDDWVWADWMRDGIQRLLNCDGVAYLPGFETSRGASLEIFVAAYLGMIFKPLEEWIK